MSFLRLELTLPSYYHASSLPLSSYLLGLEGSVPSEMTSNFPGVSAIHYCNQRCPAMSEGSVIITLENSNAHDVIEEFHNLLKLVRLFSIVGHSRPLSEFISIFMVHLTICTKLKWQKAIEGGKVEVSKLVRSLC